MTQSLRTASVVKGVAMILAAIPFYVVFFSLPERGGGPSGWEGEKGILLTILLVYFTEAATAIMVILKSRSAPEWFRVYKALAALMSVAVVIGYVTPIGWYFAPYAWMPLVGILTGIAGLMADKWWLTIAGAIAAVITPISALTANGHFWVPVVSIVFGVAWLLTARDVPFSERIRTI